MATGRPIHLDVLIFGGGAAGLWLLGHLRRQGYQALLLERSAFGAGQTIASQGIIHGGLKYTLAGLFTESARAIRDMPARWRQSLAGRRPPDLRRTLLRSEVCFLWRTGTIRSRAGHIGARAALQVRPQKVAPAQRPEALRDCPGQVYRVDEQVLSPPSFLGVLSKPQEDATIRFDPDTGLELECRAPGQITAVRIGNPEDPKSALDLRPRLVVLSAGEGNQGLRQHAGLGPGAMQRRPLHMVLARGDLPVLNGHCTDGTRTRVTITTDKDAQGRTIWQIGGQVSEDGVRLDRESLIAHALREVRHCLPGVELERAQWSTYRVDRAEPATATGQRPDNAYAKREGNVITAWPTKLALVPHLVDLIAPLLEPPGAPKPFEWPGDLLAPWPRPRVAQPPWETVDQWTHDHWAAPA